MFLQSLALEILTGDIIAAQVFVWGFAIEVLNLRMPFKEEEPIAKRQLDSFQLTFSLLQIPEMRQKVVSEADRDGFFQGNASVSLPPL